MTTDEAVRTEVASLRAAVAGPVRLPDDDGYAAETAADNLAKVHRPDAVVGVTSTDDVVAAVRWATERRWPVSLRSTGHGSGPAVDAGLMLSTSRMAGVDVDTAGGTVGVQAGVAWGQALAAASRAGLAPLVGASSRVGVVGYTLGGGLGPIARTYGLAADHVIALELVTLDGEVREVTADAEPELFWALRGGTGAFGVVTAMTFRAPALDSVYGGGLWFAAEHARDVLHAWSAWTEGLDERTSTSVALVSLPDLELLPPPLRGRRALHVRVAFVGPDEEGAGTTAWLQEVAPQLLGGLGSLPYAEVTTIHGEPPGSSAHHSRGALLARLDADALDVLADLMTGPSPLPLGLVEVRLLGGAVARPPEVPSASTGRQGAATLFAVGMLVPPVAGAVPGACQNVLDAMAPWTSEDAMVNLIGEGATQRQALAAWAPADLDRLRRLKRELDPEDLLRYGPALR